jgi:hypothetical protein
MGDPVIETVANRILNRIAPATPEVAPEQLANDREIMVAAGPIVPDQKPEEPTYEPSQGAALLQDLIRRIDLRAAERADLVAQLRRCEVSTEKADREERKALIEQSEALIKAHEAELAEIRQNLDLAISGRNAELRCRRQEIVDLDKSLDQMRKQVNAEIAKLAPERKGA